MPKHNFTLHLRPKCELTASFTSEDFAHLRGNHAPFHLDGKGVGLLTPSDAPEIQAWLDEIYFTLAREADCPFKVEPDPLVAILRGDFGKPVKYNPDGTKEEV